MLHDPSHYEPPEEAEPISLGDADKEVLRALASEVASISQDPSHGKNMALWRKLNDLESERPMVWINEICWNEMNVDDELTLKCEHPWARDQETFLRQRRNGERRLSSNLNTPPQGNIWIKSLLNPL